MKSVKLWVEVEGKKDLNEKSLEHIMKWKISYANRNFKVLDTKVYSEGSDSEHAIILHIFLYYIELNHWLNSHRIFLNDLWYSQQTKNQNHINLYNIKLTESCSRSSTIITVIAETEIVAETPDESRKADWNRQTTHHIIPKRWV